MRQHADASTGIDFNPKTLSFSSLMLPFLEVLLQTWRDVLRFTDHQATATVLKKVMDGLIAALV